MHFAYSNSSGERRQFICSGPSLTVDNLESEYMRRMYVIQNIECFVVILTKKAALREV